MAYMVKLRIMTGSEVDGYYLVDQSGNGLEVSKNKAISMISRRMIDNMRLQYNGNNVVIRGSGVNLNKLPIYDTKNHTIRGTDIELNLHTKEMAQYMIIKRAMFKNNCIGYVLIDRFGNEQMLNRARTLEFVDKGSVRNAEVRKHYNSKTGQSRVVLRGVNCDLNMLPKVLIDANGHVIDTTKQNQSYQVRAMLMRSAGIMYNEAKRTKSIFNPGDYLVCTPTGGLSVMKSSDAGKHLRRIPANTAICDDYLNNSADYSVEILGRNKIRLSPNILYRWPVVVIENKVA